MKHAILGAGGVGGAIGAILAKAGDEVVIVVRPGTADRYPPELSLQSVFGSISAPVRVVESLAESVDILWITVKAPQLESSLRSLQSPANVRGVVPLLNGIDHVAVLRRRFEHERVIPGTIAGEMERVSPGLVVHRSPFARLHLASAGRHLLESSAGKFSRFGFDCRFIDEEATLLWSKLVLLAPFALSTTAANLPIGGVLSDPARRDLLVRCLQEASAAARAAGAIVDSEAALALLQSSPPGMRSSMQKDVDAGRAPELDAIAGPILRSARERGLDAPASAELLKQITGRMSSHTTKSA